jgi:hypothetical protein
MIYLGLFLRPLTQQAYHWAALTPIQPVSSSRLGDQHATVATSQINTTLVSLSPSFGIVQGHQGVTQQFNFQDVPFLQLPLLSVSDTGQDN